MRLVVLPFCSKNRCERSGIGHFPRKPPTRPRRRLPGALVQIALATALGAATAHGFGWDWGAEILFGLSISVASTVVLTRILSDNNALHTQTGHIAIGWLVVEDIFTVLVLVLVPTLAGQGGQRTDNALLSIGSAVGKIALLITITFFVGKRWLPVFLGWVAATRSRELFTLSVLAVALGIGVGSATLFGTSMALGAFLAGMIVNQSAYSHRAAIELSRCATLSPSLLRLCRNAIQPLEF